MMIAKKEMTVHDQACIELTTGFMMGELGACEFKHAKSEDGTYDSAVLLRKEAKKKRRGAKGKKKNKRASCKSSVVLLCSPRLANMQSCVASRFQWRNYLGTYQSC